MKKLLSILLLIFYFLAFSGISAIGEVLFVDTDNVGSPVAMWNSSGSKVWEAEYYPFGEEYQTSQTPNDNKNRFLGKEKDSETGLTYLGARYFDEKSGRFLTPDPVKVVDPFTSTVNYEMLANPQRLNRYAYGLNNPYRFVDPDGDFAIVAALAIIGTAVALLATNPDVANAPAVGETTESSNGAAGIISEGAAAIATGYIGGKILGKIASKGGTSAFRQGTFADESADWGGNYIKGKQWAADNPLTTKGYAKKYGLPTENTGKPDWVVKGRVENYKTRPAPASHNNPANTGGGTEIIPDNSNNVTLDWFYMPD